MDTNKPNRFSYSQVETYKKCPYKFKLIYRDGNRVEESSVATEFGSLLHYIEEHMGLDFKEGKTVDYDYYKNLFLNINLDSGDEKIYGANILKEKYANEWGVKNKDGLSYIDKTNIYLTSGIYRLGDFLNENLNLEVYTVEMKFETTIKNKVFSGFIDRVFYDKSSNTYVIEDVKTYTKLLTKNALVESLQMYIYTIALREVVGPDAKIICFYEIPLLGVKQASEVNTKKVYSDVVDTLDKIGSGQFQPNATPLCHWCVFSGTYPNQPKEAEGLCPYYSHWTKENKVFTSENKWQGESKHKFIIEKYIKGGN